MTVHRRELLRRAALYGAALALPGMRGPRGSRPRWQRRDELFPQGVASGDPLPDSVLLWTRRPPLDGRAAKSLTMELAADESFAHVIARVPVTLSPDNDWTCRVLAAGLTPSTEYWYRFTDDAGNGSRIGRTLTAPRADDTRPVRFTFVSCQNIPAGASNAYAVMLRDDRARPADERIQFVLHLGDFVYEVVWYPEDRPQGYYSRRPLRDVVRYPTGEKISDFHIPVTLDDYRTLYRGYLTDLDLLDARARWPFVCMWDNHEFSWKGWQSQQEFGGVRPAQTRKMAATQAWFEYQPARVARTNVRNDRFVAPVVHDAPITAVDEHGLGLEPNNLAAVNAMQLARTFRWGRHVELILTDNRTYRSEPVMQKPDAAAFATPRFPAVRAGDVVEILDAGREYQDGHAPETIAFGGRTIPNFRKDAPAQSMLGGAQKAWFLDALRRSTARWKLWGNSVALLDWRMDFQRLRGLAGMPDSWPDGYAHFTDDDWAGYLHERGEILDAITAAGITGVISCAGDRHAFMAGVVAKTLPPRAYKPAVAEFVTGSVSAPGICEAMEFNVRADNPLHAVYVGPGGNGVNMSAMHGVATSIEYARTGSATQAAAARNPECAPHLSFADAGGHGFARVTASADDVVVEFVCVPRPLTRASDGGPVRYRVTQRVPLWRAGEVPRVELVAREGDVPLGSLPTLT